MSMSIGLMYPHLTLPLPSLLHATVFTLPSIWMTDRKKIAKQNCQPRAAKTKLFHWAYFDCTPFILNNWKTFFNQDKRGFGEWAMVDGPMDPLDSQCLQVFHKQKESSLFRRTKFGKEGGESNLRFSWRRRLQVWACWRPDEVREATPPQSIIPSHPHSSDRFFASQHGQRLPPVRRNASYQEAHECTA